MILIIELKTQITFFFRCLKVIKIKFALFLTNYHAVFRALFEFNSKIKIRSNYICGIVLLKKFNINIIINKQIYRILYL